MFSTVCDIFCDEILDCLPHEDLKNLTSVLPAICRMYKSKFLCETLSLTKNMFIECSYCDEIRFGKFRKGRYVCLACISEIISISIE